MGGFVGRVQAFALALGGPGLFIVAFLDSSFLSLPEINDILLTLDGKVLENARQFGVNVHGKAGQEISLEIQRGANKLTKRVAVLQRPPDREQLLSKLEGALVPRLGVLAVDLDEKVTPLLPQLRRFAGVVVVGVTEQGSGFTDRLLPGDVIYSVNGAAVGSLKELEAALSSRTDAAPVAVQLERAGQLQYAVVDLQ